MEKHEKRPILPRLYFNIVRNYGREVLFKSAGTGSAGDCIDTLTDAGAPTEEQKNAIWI